MHAESVDARLVAALGLGGRQGRVDLEEDVVEAGAEVGAVDGVVARGFGVVDVLAARAVELDVGHVGYVVLAHGQQVLRFADDARAFAEDALFEFLHLSVLLGFLSLHFIVFQLISPSWTDP